jgi:hypothetical protein
MDFFDEDLELTEWLPYWSHIAACAKMKMDLGAKGYQLEGINEFLTDDEYLQIRKQEPWYHPKYHPGIYYVQTIDMLGISVELYGDRKEDASWIIRNVLNEFQISFKDYGDDFSRDMFIIPLHKVRELIDEYLIRKNSAYLYPRIPSHRKLEPELICEIEKLKRSGELFDTSFEVRQFASELTERFGNRLQNFVNRRLKS